MYFWFVIETYDNLLSSCCCYMAALYFETHFLEFKNILDLWFELVHDVFVLIDVLACILTTFQLFLCVLPAFLLNFLDIMWNI